MSTNRGNYPQEMNVPYGNVGTGPNQGRRVLSAHLPANYPSQAQAGHQGVTPQHEGQQMAVNQRAQVARPKMALPGQHYQAYVHQGHTPMHSNNQISSRQYPYYAVQCMQPSSGQIVGAYQGVQNSTRGYTQTYGRRPVTLVRMQHEDKPTPLTYHSNQQLNAQPAVNSPSSVAESAVEHVDAIYHYDVEGSDWICIRTVAVLIGESGFKPISALQVTKDRFAFAIVLQDRNKNTTRTSVHIEGQHINSIAFCECIPKKYVLAILLNDLGREALHPKLQWVEPIRSYDLVFSCDLLSDFNILHVKLTSFFGPKFKFLARPYMQQNKKLVYSAVVVARYARFLENAERKQKTGTRKADPTPSSSGNGAVQNDRKNNLPVGLPQSVSVQNKAAGNVESKVKVSNKKTPPDAVVSSRSDIALSVRKDPNAVYPGGDEMVMQQRGTETVAPSNNQESASGSASLVPEEVMSEEWSSNTLGSDTAERTHTEQTPPQTCGDSLKNDIVDSSSNEDCSSAGDKKHMTAAEYLRTFSCSDSQVIDFPEDFLATEPSCESKERAVSEPATVHHTQEHTHEELTLDDDEFEKEEPTSLKFEGDVALDIASVRQSMPLGAFMSGSLVNFFFKHYIPYEALKDDYRKDKICFFDSLNYEFIRRQCQKEFLRYLVENVTAEKAVALFGRRKKKKELHPFIMNLIEFELVVIPLFWDNHWLLGLLQIFPSSGEDSISGRLVLIDSKFDDPVNKEVLERISESIHGHIIVAIKAALVTSDKPRRLKDFALIRCDSLPCQTNNSDCGWFMCLFAEYYTKNINWMALTNEEVRSMSLSSPEEEKFLARLRTIKREVGAYIEKAAKRSLCLEYDKVVQPPPATKRNNV
ncbi:hypothetical protein Y032_0184g976 [Ancylostoma ceylanicum]|nr:hypothetical protein Y032_0184g976 [Ancylostoma ceylanicum]